MKKEKSQSELNQFLIEPQPSDTSDSLTRKKEVKREILQMMKVQMMEKV